MLAVSQQCSHIALHCDVTVSLPWADILHLQILLVPVLSLCVIKRGEAGANPLPLLPQAHDTLSCARLRLGRRLKEARVPTLDLGQTSPWVLDLTGVPYFKHL